MFQILPLSILAASVCSALPAADLFSEPFEEHSLNKRALPFNRIIAFGDDYTDNSQGSYAHGITGDEVTREGAGLWGAGTWTDGPVAVTYMSQFLRMPIAYDYAFGSSLGGQKYGSVCNNSAVDPSQLSSYSYLLNGQLVPDAIGQVSNYTTNPTTRANIAKTLHVFWTGNNDVIASLGWVGRFTLCVDDKLCVPGQQQFINNLNACMTSQLLNLVRAGAKYILVPDVFPRHLSPWTNIWITSNQSFVNNFGNVVNQVNARLQTSINQINKFYGTQIVYFPANALMRGGLSNPVSAGIGPGQGGSGAPGYITTCVDGCPAQGPVGISNWDLYWAKTIVNKGADQFFWMTEVVASTTVHKALGNWMAYYINNTPWK